MAIPTTDDLGVSAILRILQQPAKEERYNLDPSTYPGQNPSSSIQQLMLQSAPASPTSQDDGNLANFTPGQAGPYEPPVNPIIHQITQGAANGGAAVPPSMMAGNSVNIPPGLMPASVPEYSFDKKAALGNAGKIGGALTILQALGVISPQTMSQIGGNAVSTAIESPRAQAEAQYKHEMENYTTRHQLVQDYINTARINQLGNYRQATLDQKINTADHTVAKSGLADMAAITPLQFVDPATGQPDMAKYNAALDHISGTIRDQLSPAAQTRWDQDMEASHDEAGNWHDVSNAAAYWNGQRANVEPTIKTKNEAETRQINANITDKQVQTIDHALSIFGTDGYAGMPPARRANVVHLVESTLGIPMGDLGVPSSIKDLNERLKQKGFDLTQMNVKSEIARRTAQTANDQKRTDIMEDSQKSRDLIDKAHSDYFRYMMHEDPTGQKLHGELPLTTAEYQKAYANADRDFTADDKLVNNPTTAISHNFTPQKMKAISQAHQDPEAFLNDPASVGWLKDATVNQTLHHALEYNKLWAQQQAAVLGYDSPDMLPPPVSEQVAPVTPGPGNIKPLSNFSHPAAGGAPPLPNPGWIDTSHPGQAIVHPGTDEADMIRSGRMPPGSVHVSGEQWRSPGGLIFKGPSSSGAHAPHMQGYAQHDAARGRKLFNAIKIP